MRGWGVRLGIFDQAEEWWSSRGVSVCSLAACEGRGGAIAVWGRRW